jgi:hypothetical protein
VCVIHSFNVCTCDKCFFEFLVVGLFCIINENVVVGLTIHLVFVIHTFLV